MTTRSKEVVGPRGDELSLDTRGHAERLGRSWANDLHAALVREKRRASGGWPGTLGEARVHVARALRCQGMRRAHRVRERAQRLERDPRYGRRLLSRTP
jgi:hypothetical protein